MRGKKSLDMLDLNPFNKHEIPFTEHLRVLGYL